MNSFHFIHIFYFQAVRHHENVTFSNVGVNLHWQNEEFRKTVKKYYMLGFELVARFFNRC
jgi:hypothetical protein